MLKSILVCDNEPIIRMQLKTMLIKLGFTEIYECGDGKSAVEMAMACFPDLAILDVSLPIMDGITAGGEIQKKLRIPIMLLTGCYGARTVKRAVECGITAFVSKPLREQDLFPTMQLAVAHSEEINKLKKHIKDLSETIECRKTIEKAKVILMERDGLSGADAYRTMQKLSMDTRKAIRQVADSILKNTSESSPQGRDEHFSSDASAGT